MLFATSCRAIMTAFAQNFSAALCPVCAGRLLSVLRDVRDPLTRRPFELLRCADCGLGQTNPIPGDLAPYYAGYHCGRHGVTASLCIRRRIRFLRRATGHRAPGALLDIGCGDGSLLLAARDIGWQVQGTEFNPLLARQRGLAVVSDLSEISASARFDCITLWHSLEHLRDPLYTMQCVRSLLAPTGVLLLAVPDSTGLQASLFAGKWFHLDVPRHLYHYSKRSLSALLSAAGFSPVSWRYQEFEYDLLGWSQSALNCFLPTPNVFFHLLTRRTPCCSKAEKLISALGGAALTGFSLPLIPLGSLLHCGATLVVDAHPVRVPEPILR